MTRPWHLWAWWWLRDRLPTSRAYERGYRDGWQDCQADLSVATRGPSARDVADAYFVGLDEGRSA